MHLRASRGDSMDPGEYCEPLLLFAFLSAHHDRDRRFTTDIFARLPGYPCTQRRYHGNLGGICRQLRTFTITALDFKEMASAPCVSFTTFPVDRLPHPTHPIRSFWRLTLRARRSGGIKRPVTSSILVPISTSVSSLHSLLSSLHTLGLDLHFCHDCTIERRTH